MSTTTTTSDDEDRTTTATMEEIKPRYKCRKVAILFAYCGVGYQGIKKNPGAKTIEGDLEECSTSSALCLRPTTAARSGLTLPGLPGPIRALASSARWFLASSTSIIMLIE
ncbi:hypothetical protein OSB04_028795 [Centaurea solstitialis]|uniref:tRNA pseudouridine synthase n=1 Tax=Centaurea solstitialis TaxID=347529 RepID=A0AA38SHZ7_9ASTR|nr:hypothetical protein OSB04_028795 [Centaurea solstitialis]